MRHLPLPRFAAFVLTAASAFAQIPNFSVVNTGLDSTFGSAGKGIVDPQVQGLTGVAFGAGLFVAIGNSVNEDVIRWATSPDGTTWTGRSQAIGGGMKSFTNSKVHFLNGKFMFFAEHSLPSGGSAWVYTSADGLTWTQAKVANGRHRFEEFDASPTLTVAAGSDGDQYSSSDLVTWTPSPVVTGGGLYSHNDVTFGAGRFISTINGFGGQTYSSADAVTWTALPGLLTPGGGRVEFGNGVHLLNLGTIRRSTDGITFTTFTPTLPTGWINLSGDLRFTGGRFIGQAVDLSGGAIRIGYLGSTDGTTWSPVGYLPPAPTAAAGQSRLYVYTDIAFGNGRYVLVGVDSIQTLATRTSLPLVISGEGAAAPTPPVITGQPVAQNGVAGGSVTFSVATAATAGNAYQWRKDGVNLAGATAATLTINNLSATNAGSYTVVITNAVGTITSNPAVLALVTASTVGRLVNMSIRTGAGTGDNTLIVGVALGGAGTSGNKAVLLRGIGPTLTSFGVGGAIADPVMTVFQGSTQAAQNDDWDAALAPVFASFGAFALTAGGRDAAIYNATIPSASYSIQITGKNNGTGIALAEVYDATPTASFAATTPRLVNVSARTQVGTGDNILIAGFVVGGQSPVRVLVRAVGPTLGAFGVGGTLSDPKLELFSGTTKTAENDNWGGTAELKAAFSSVAAFAFSADTSRDAALVATLQPGSYTAQISGVGNTAGVALVEVYELP